MYHIMRPHYAAEMSHQNATVTLHPCGFTLNSTSLSLTQTHTRAHAHAHTCMHPGRRSATVTPRPSLGCPYLSFRSSTKKASCGCIYCVFIAAVGLIPLAIQHGISATLVMKPVLYIFNITVIHPLTTDQTQHRVHSVHTFSQSE